MNSTSNSIDWRAKAAALSLPREHFVDGRHLASTGQDRFETIDPATMAVLGDLPQGTAADVDVAVAAARRSFEQGVWSRVTPLHRKAVLLRLAELIERDADELALLDTLEMGKPIAAARAEIAFATGFFRYYGEATDKIYGATNPSASDTIGMSLLEPRGVIGAIVPWNFPLVNAAVKAAPALAAGNSVVLKPSELASFSALRLAELGAEAGIPAGVFSVLAGLGTTVGEAMGRHRDIDLLSFTGSTATGRRLMVMAGESNGKPLMLECGGKSPQVLCADMADDIEAVAARVVQDAFWNQGQWCAAKSRLIVEDSFHDTLMDAVLAASATLVPADPLDPASNFGPLASATQANRVTGFIAAARAEGGECLTPERTLPETGCYVAPTVFTGISREMGIAQDEVFGPVLSVLRFSDFDEAMALANATHYGLAATVWTRDARRTHAAAKAIRAGRVTLRASAAASDHSGFALGAEPWGASGFGVEGGIEGLRAYSRLKSLELVS
ncbi:aldehyde dehydrogenase family protein [Novosphingobium mathurense]|uniref:Gamma-glutamyl-gamma-aminobutyraldehyde dehydrogenase n=1 Tax=Novosphingobium mathurense TaxID=428990 RepID=A0A1U6IQD0_9SPHN|nr:aldehyde dehydrogenase family protein [Novosphingobium mathurense]SLK10164.1 gamma-glutamyl-gamma-aminobutyraldehyde dehydrogenase [Novosphingobium mathurense]